VLSKEAYNQLQTIYATARPGSSVSFEEFVGKMQREASPTEKPAEVQSSASSTHRGEYAGSAACKQCHADVYRNWGESGMSRMLRPYRPENVIGDFEKNNQFYAGDAVVYQDGKVAVTPGASRSLFARMTIRDGRHYFDIKQADGLWHSYPVDYTIGSKWQQAYATKLPNGQIHVFPIQYNLSEKKWMNYWKVIDAPGSERANPLNWEKLDASTNYMINCAVCHTSQLRNTHGGGFDPDNLAFLEPGVDCEMCHGPSADHIAAMESGSYSEKRPLDPPVEFDRISNRDFVAICGQCHMQSNLHADSARGELNYSTKGTFFLKNPELPLSEFTRETFFKDGRFRQTTFMVEALERSQCFRKGQVNCSSCHDPHSHDEPSNLTSLKFKDDPDRMCTGCHTQFQDKLRATAHTHHPFASEGSRCVSCHMPRIMDALLFRARSHQIDDIPNAAMTLRFGQSESPNACLLCHAEQTAQWVQSQLQSWKATP
jgi:predicted CXXCH cytochrome family protein